MASEVWRIQITNRALNDLKAIFEFLCLVHAESTAERILLGLLKRIDQLVLFPYSGRVDPYAPVDSNQYRYKIDGHYKIAYRIHEGKEIEVLRIYETRKAPPTFIA